MATRSATKRQAAKGQEPRIRSVDRRACEWVMLGLGNARRFTQDSPVLPDVWLRFAENLDARCELLLTPFGESRPGELRARLDERLDGDQKKSKRKKASDGRELIYNQSTVLATLNFDELVRVVLPLTDWWRKALWRRVEGKRTPILPEYLNDPTVQEEIAQALTDPERKASRLGLSPDLLWIFRIVGFLALARTEPGSGGAKTLALQNASASGPGETTDLEMKKRDWLPEVAAVAKLIDGIAPPKDDDPRIWTVNLNRQASTAVFRSSVAVKADAARRLFEVNCKDIVWAIIDSGVDATHPAFRLRKDPDSTGLRQPYDAAFEQVNGRTCNRTRIVATYDFRLIRDLLNPARLDPPSPKLPARVRKLLVKANKDSPKVIKQLQQLAPRLLSGNEIDWTLLEPLLEVPMDEHYLNETEGETGEVTSHIPINDHGTHCAGILAGDWHDTDSTREGQQSLVGICPDLRLYDLRVFDENGRGDEFSIIAALQYIRFKNAHKDYFVIHGANLSMSIKHDVMNFACGRTPVCEEAERLVNNGVVVVAAAGNEGYVKYQTVEGLSEGYSSISITDPGNADLVITVGATHRFKPHTYGVSYFSSRGPTGDGRIKPDIVAPGEKIEAPVPGVPGQGPAHMPDSWQSGRKDGTSMATPHVSGAAAMLMARYEELIGKPVRIKEILMQTATDLGRERYFQGAGMLDILRALQSV
jgi:serine protease AprX